MLLAFLLEGEMLQQPRCFLHNMEERREQLELSFPQEEKENKYTSYKYGSPIPASKFLSAWAGRWGPL